MLTSSLNCIRLLILYKFAFDFSLFHRKVTVFCCIAITLIKLGLYQYFLGQNQYSVFLSQFQYKILMNQYSWRHCLGLEATAPGNIPDLCYKYPVKLPCCGEGTGGTSTNHQNLYMHSKDYLVHYASHIMQ